MILVDTSVWVSHFRTGNDHLEEILLEFQVLTHPFVIGEIACGSLRRRKEVLDSVAQLPQVQVAEHAEVLRMLEERVVWGKGIGWIDAHLLCSALLTGCRLWTLDASLHAMATRLKVAYAAPCERDL